MIGSAMLKIRRIRDGVITSLLIGREPRMGIGQAWQC